MKFSQMKFSRMNSHLEALIMDLDVLAVTEVPEYPPRFPQQPSVIIRLTELRKSGTYLLQIFKASLKTTSKDQGHVAAAAICRRLIRLRKRL